MVLLNQTWAPFNSIRKIHTNLSNFSFFGIKINVLFWENGVHMFLISTISYGRCGVLILLKEQFFAIIFHHQYVLFIPFVLFVSSLGHLSGYLKIHKSKTLISLSTRKMKKMQRRRLVRCSIYPGWSISKGGLTIRSMKKYLQPNKKLALIHCN